MPGPHRPGSRLLLEARHATAFTGAGISVESGIPPFRGPGGLWSRVDPGFIEIDYFQAQPAKSWRKIKEIFYDFLGGARPNAAHFGVAALEAAGRLKAVITQNIDGLHQEAGSREVIEFHGNSRWLVCLECQQARGRAVPSVSANCRRAAPAAGCSSPTSSFSARASPRRPCSAPTRKPRRPISS